MTNYSICCFWSFFHFLDSIAPDNKFHKQNWCMLFFTQIKLVVYMLVCVCVGSPPSNGEDWLFTFLCCQPNLAYHYPSPYRVTPPLWKWKFWRLPNFHGFPDFGLESSVCLAILGILKGTQIYKGSKSFKEQVQSTTCHL